MLHLGAFSFVHKNPKLNPPGMTLRTEVQRALRVIASEVYTEMLGSFLDKKFHKLLRQRDTIEALQNGIIVKKALLLSDLAGSTPFLGGIAKHDHGKLGVILREILGWQAKIIKDHGGIVDKFYGDEIRAYFGSELTDPEEDKAVAYCNSAYEAAKMISSQFPSKLHELFDGAGGICQPASFTYPRIILHYDKVLWAMYGSESHRDLTIWTANVALLNRILARVREKQPYGKRNLEGAEIDEAVGEVYLTEQFKLRLSEANKFGLKKLKIPPAYKDIDIRAQLYGIKVEAPGT
jgi:class 3 adenylate cyclase